MDAASQLGWKVAGLQMAVPFQNGPQGVHAVQRRGVFLLPAALPPPAVEAERIVGVVDDPAEGLASVGQGVVDLVDGLCEGGQAFGHRFQPGGRGRKTGPLLRCVRFVCGHRGQPAAGQQRGQPQPRPGAEGKAEGTAGRLDAEHPRHTAARIGGKGFHPASGGQQSSRCTGAGEPGRRRAEGGIRPAEGRTQHGTAGKGGFPLTPAAEGGFQRRAEHDAKADRPQCDTAQGRSGSGPDEQHPRAGRFGREPPQGKAQRPRQQGVRPAGEQQVYPAAGGAEGKADGPQPHGPAARQQGGPEPTRPEPPCRYGGPDGAEQTDAVQRQRPEPMEQQPQHCPGRTGSEAVFRKAERQPQPEGDERSIQHRPAAEQPGQKSRTLPQSRADGCARQQRRRKGMEGILPEKIVHKKIPAFRRGSFALFCFPRLVHIL